MLQIPELLAPAGDAERLRYAINYGADAVYCGLPEFGMRSAPANFTPEQLTESVIYAHARGRKVYLTMNTLPTNEEADRLPEAIKEAAKAGVDAFIVADLGVLEACKTFAPDIDVHMSTQTGITNWAAARAAYDLGAKRVVLAREMTLQDIAILTGGTVLSSDLGMELADANIEMLGKVSQAVIDKENTILVGGAGTSEAIEERIAEIKNQIAASTSDFDKEKMQERIGKLSGGVAVIKVGAATEVEMKEKKLRIEDALSATKAAVEEGIVAGGGTALINAIPAVEKLVPSLDGDEKTGAKIVLRALEAPLRQIAANAGLEGSIIVDKIRRSRKVGYGFDAYNETYCDMMSNGIVDPTKVTRSALQNAASIASMVLTTESAVANIPKEEPAAAAPAAGGMGGMN